MLIRRADAPPSLVEQLGLKRVGDQWRGACPVCGYGSNAFALVVNRNGSLHGWCASCEDRDAIEKVLTGDADAVAPAVDPAVKAHDAARNRQRAGAMALGAVAVRSTAAERYLKNRGLPWLVKSEVLRFAPAVPHPTGCPRLPAMIAVVTDADGNFLAIHRTYLTSDGRKADVVPDKASLGPIGGGVIRLEPHRPGKPLIIGEGIESSASGGKLIGAPAWAAVSAGNLAKAPALPTDISKVIIAGDRGEPGERAARLAELRWRAEGREVDTVLPDDGEGDFNDILLRGAR